VKITWTSTVYDAGVNQTRLYFVYSLGWVQGTTVVATSNSQTTSTSTGVWIGSVPYGTDIKIQHYTTDGRQYGMGGNDYIAGSDGNINASLTIEDPGAEYIQY
jgi:hypothetical protein